MNKPAPTSTPRQPRTGHRPRLLAIGALPALALLGAACSGGTSHPATLNAAASARRLGFRPDEDPTAGTRISLSITGRNIITATSV